MDKDTKIELLKILAMVIILVMLIIGIVWMNKEDKVTTNNTTLNNVVEENGTNQSTIKTENGTQETTTENKMDEEQINETVENNT